MESVVHIETGMPRSYLTVGPDWIDGNDHMNACYYLLAVKNAALEAHDLWDYGVAFRERTGESNFVLESHIRHFRELKLGTRLLVTTRLADLDDKRLHLAFEIHDADRDYLAAIVEFVTIHVRMAPPSAKSMPDDLHARLVAVKAVHDGIPLPPQAGGCHALNIHRRPARQ
ncbi:hypothetical protein C2U72_05115 [Prosthecomicrobium hirschii]|uniref:thioesterase family protein n=1 Tax=Prosthecodimorpha hirschii TaxID=665126 RepID=UPI001128C14F|nr:thioesterase family protein [Prosthecomicrobium hirschii]TPQ52066.1 hypothetical protein C2U72_05115 [Prosthecomicrobium hirschii]